MCAPLQLDPIPSHATTRSVPYIETLQSLEIPNCPGLFYLYGRSGELLFFASSQNIARDVKGLKKYDQLPKQLLKRVLSTHSVSTKKAGHISLH